jgi:lysophospholipase L1-like esterase
MERLEDNADAHRGRRALTRIALSVASIVLVLGVAEGLSRLAWREVEHRPVEVPASDLPVLSRLDLNRANSQGLFKGTFYRTNRATLRGPEYDPTPPAGIFRIAVAGDSVTAGSGVDEEDTYSAELERLLDADDDAERFQVINMGLGGINARWVINRMKRASKFYTFQLAIYGWTPNDIEGDHYEEVEGREDWVEHWAAVARVQNHPSYLVRALWPRFMSLRTGTLREKAARDEEMRWNYLENRAAWNDFVAALDDFAHFVKQRGICGHVFIHSRRAELLEVHDRVALAAEARGLTVSRSMPAFAGREPSEFWLSPFDAHPNVEGHALLAKALHDGLREGLPAHCWRARVEDWPTSEPPRRKSSTRGANAHAKPTGPES